jgi:hypothetical protein
MIISSILKRENLKIDYKLNILWTPSDREFEEFIINLGYNLISFNQTYYADSTPHLIICNNKIEHHQYCYNLSRKLHLPVLLIDHTIKNPLFDNAKIKDLDNFPCYHHICVSKKISDSWELKNAQILSYNINDKDNINIWKNLIFQIAKKLFKI